MKQTSRRSMLLLGLLLLTSSAWGQIEEYGASSWGAAEGITDIELPPRHAERGLSFFHTHFAPSDYEAYPQNWAATQDERGVIYVANLHGILEYDGVSWRQISTLTNTSVMSLDAGKDGKIYVGSRGDFGYLEPDSLESLQYASLIDHVDPDQRDFEQVWGTHYTEEGVFFQTRRYLFRWDGMTIESWEAEGRFHTSFSVGNRLLVRDNRAGMLEVENDSLVQIPDGDHFDSVSVFMVAPYDEEVLLFASPDGLYLHDGTSLTSFETEVDDWLSESDLYHGTALEGGLFALATLGSGVTVINRQGQLIDWLHEENGLPDNWVNHVFQDKQGGVWLALNNRGVVRTEVAPSLTYYDNEHGLSGVIERMARSGSQLYLATSTDLFELNSGGLTATGDRLSKPRFQPIQDVGGNQFLSLLDAEGLLFAGTDEGIFVLDGEKTIGYSEFSEVFHMAASRQDDDTFFIGHREGLSLTELESGSTLTERDRIRIPSGVLHFQEDDGDIWVIDRSRGLWRVEDTGRSAGRDRYVIEQIPSLLEGGEQLSIRYVLRIFDEVVFITSDGFYRYDDELSAFVDNEQLTSRLGVIPGALISIFSHDALGGVGAVLDDGRVLFAFEEDDETVAHFWPRALRFDKTRPIQIHLDDDGTMWLSDQNRLLRYDPRIARSYDRPFRTLIRKISVPSENTTIYGGAPTLEERREIEYPAGEVLIEAAAPSFNLSEETEYQFMIQGHDDEWSSWSTTASKRYNLREGSYTLRARSRNAQGIEGEEARYSFTILPPWYRTWWAYALYFIGVSAVLMLSVAYRRALKEKQRARIQGRALLREREVRQRMREANRRLNQANRHLKKANQMKEEIMANTSHELRTPLTAILGFAEILKDEVDEEHREFVQLIESNGERLLETLTQLLEIAELRAGSVRMHPKKVNVVEPIARIVRLFTPLAEKKDLELGFHSPEIVEATLDQAYLEQVVYNLVGNAIKFTEEGGVEVILEETCEHIVLHIRDTGIGIDEEFLSNLFEEFTQESSGLARDYEGSGLGLSITSQLVTLMHGDVTVDSEKGAGSVFTVRLPRSVSKSNYTVA